MKSTVPEDITWFASDPLNREILSNSSLNSSVTPQIKSGEFPEQINTTERILKYIRTEQVRV
jgi:hypothetical protein